jgi:hypothetical protein
LQWEQEYLDNSKYTLDMVKIDNKIKDVIFEIKSEESRIASREAAILNATPEVSVAT